MPTRVRIPNREATEQHCPHLTDGTSSASLHSTCRVAISVCGSDLERRHCRPGSCRGSRSRPAGGGRARTAGPPLVANVENSCHGPLSEHKNFRKRPLQSCLLLASTCLYIRDLENVCLSSRGDVGHSEPDDGDLVTERGEVGVTRPWQTGGPHEVRQQHLQLTPQLVVSIEMESMDQSTVSWYLDWLLWFPPPVSVGAVRCRVQPVCGYLCT